MNAGDVILRKDEYAIKIKDSKDFPAILEQVRALPGRKWDVKSRSWFVKINKFTTNRLKEIGFTIPFQQLAKSTKSRDLFSDGETYGLRGYQCEGIQLMHDFRGRVLLADEMGLGKTVEVVMYFRLNPSLSPVLIVCPSAVKYTWKREINKWYPDEKNVFVVDGSYPELPKIGISIINYELLKRFAIQKKSKSKTGKEKIKYKVKRFSEVGYKLIIFDEVHRIMNSSSQRTKISLEIVKGVERIIGLSGTPFVNRPIEIFNFISMLRPEIFNSRWRFAERFCDLSNNGFGWSYGGCNKENTKELHELLTSTVMIRRLKKDVLKDLPPRQISVIPFELDNYDEYLRAEDDMLKNIGTNSNSFLVQCEYLKSIAMQGKFEAIIEWIKNVLEETGEKLVVMAHHKEVIDAICSDFKDICVRYTGSENAKQKNENESIFQNEKDCRLFVGSLKAAGEGITLTAASKLAMIELLWNPAVHDQAGDRIHRFGQTQPVNIYYLLANNTIEMELAEMIDDKRGNADSIVDGKEVSKSMLLMELYNKYKDKRRKK